MRVPTSALRNEISPSAIDERVRETPSITNGTDSPTHIASQDLQTVMKSPKRQHSLVPDVSREGDGIPGELRPRTANYHGVNLDESLPIPQNTEQDIPPILRRTNSANAIAQSRRPQLGRNERRLSFSLAENSMFLSDGMPWPDDTAEAGDVEYEYVRQRYIAEELKRIRAAIKGLSQGEAAWAARQMEALEEQLRQATEDEEVLRGFYDGPAEAAQQLQDLAGVVIRDEEEMLEEGRRELETLAAKLDYEIDNLQSKIEDVELGVEEFERAVHTTEMRMEEVQGDSFRGAWRCVMS